MLNDADFFLMDTVDSTNHFLFERQLKKEYLLCLAEHQSHGVGTFNRSWFSPYGLNIYLSLKTSIPIGLSREILPFRIVLLNLIKSSLQKKFPSVVIQIKLPNDIYINNKKLCGLLIHARAFDKNLELIFGLGINVNMTFAELKNSWTSISMETGKNHDRNIIVSILLERIVGYLEKVKKGKLI